MVKLPSFSSPAKVKRAVKHPRSAFSLTVGSSKDLSRNASSKILFSDKNDCSDFAWIRPRNTPRNAILNNGQYQPVSPLNGPLQLCTPFMPTILLDDRNDCAASTPPPANRVAMRPRTISPSLIKSLSINLVKDLEAEATAEEGFQTPKPRQQSFDSTGTNTSSPPELVRKAQLDFFSSQDAPLPCRLLIPDDL